MTDLQHDCNFHDNLIKSDMHVTWGRGEGDKEPMCPSVSERIVEVYCQGKQEEHHNHVVWKEDQKTIGQNYSK